MLLQKCRKEKLHRMSLPSHAQSHHHLELRAMAPKAPDADSRIPQPSSDNVDSPVVPSHSSWLSLHRFRQQMSLESTDGIISYDGKRCRNGKTIPRRSSSDGVSKASKSTGGNDASGGGAAACPSSRARPPSARASLNDLCKRLRKIGSQGNGGSLLRSRARAASSRSNGKNNGTEDEPVDGSEGSARNTPPEDIKSPGKGTFGSSRDFHSMYEVVSPLIGEGSTCQVMEVKRKSSMPYHGYGGDCSLEALAAKGKSQTYACKVVKIATAAGHNSDNSAPSGSDRNNTPEATREMVTMELQVMKSLGCHPSILALHDVIWSSGCAEQCYLVTELAKGGTLADVLGKRGRLNESVAKSVMSQVLEAVGFMHSHGLAHRDLKPHNIFLMEPNKFGPGNIKVADFGLAKYLASDTSLNLDDSKKCDTERHTVCGSPLYVAPEMLMMVPKKDSRNGKSLAHYGLKVDMWACGIILFHLLSGNRPFSHATGIHALFRAIRAGDYTMEMSSLEWLGVSTDGKDFVKFLLEVDPEKRPTASQALNHTWLSGRSNASRVTCT